MKLLDVAGYGTDLLGAAVVAWYAGSKYFGRAGDAATRQTAAMDVVDVAPAPRTDDQPPAPRTDDQPPAPRTDDQPSAPRTGDRPPATQMTPLLKSIIARTSAPVPPAPELIIASASADPADDEDTGMGAEELLMAEYPGFGSVIERRLEQLWRGLAFLGWFRPVVAVPLGLALFILVIALFVVLLPVLIVGFLLDSDRDYRLRIIVLLFAVGICLQAASELMG